MTSDTIRILHVEDEPDFAEVTAEFLKREDPRFTFDSAPNAEQGLSALESGEFDCIVSDYSMPKQNGIEFLERVREDYPDLPFILFTGKGSEEIASEAISAGVSDYLQKGAGSGQYAVLANRITNAVEQYRSTRELEANQQRLSLFFDKSPMGVIEWNEDFEAVRCNDAAESILGYRQTELIGETWRKIVPEAVLEEIENEVASSLLEAEGGYYSVNDNIRKDGERITCEWHNRVVTNETGEVVTIFSLFQDVTERKERQLEIERTTQRLEAIIEASPHAIIVSDTDGVIERWNPAAQDIFGWDQSEAIGEKAPFVPDEKLSEFEGHLEQIRRGESFKGIETYRETAEGEVIDVRISVAPIRASDGTISGAIAVFEDISDRKERERALEETTERMELALEGSDSWIWEWNLETDTITQSAVTGIFGHDGDERTGPIDDFLDEMHSNDPEDVIARKEAALKEGGTYYNEFRLFKEGEERWIESRGQVYLDDPGEPDRIIGIATDVTDRKERERNLERMERLLNRSEDSLLVSDPETAEIRYANDTACQRLGYERETLLDMTILDIQVNHTDIEPWQEHVEQLKAEGNVFFEGEHVRRDGTTFPVEVNASLESIGDNDYVIGAVRDITHRKEYEHELKRQIDRLNEFTSVVSHDLRNPLNVADGRLQLAQEECDSEHLDGIAQALERMQTLIGDLLTVAREGTAATELEAIELADMVSQCWENVEASEAKVMTDIEPTRTIRADQGRLRQLLENLLRNAVDHGSDDVTVRVGELDDGLFVADDGPGVPNGEEELVFEMGYSNSDDGTGFGLSIVRQVAESHGWEIEVVESEAGGARFEITGVEFV